MCKIHVSKPKLVTRMGRLVVGLVPYLVKVMDLYREEGETSGRKVGFGVRWSLD